MMENTSFVGNCDRRENVQTTVSDMYSGEVSYVILEKISFSLFLGSRAVNTF